MTSGLKTLLLIGAGIGIAIALMGIAAFQLSRSVQQEPVVEISFVSSSGETKFLIHEDGSFVHTDSAGKKTGGLVELKTLLDLKEAIAKADFDTMRQQKRQNACQSLAKETQATYTFYQNSKAEVIASCETQIVHGSSLFRSVAAVQQDIIKSVSLRQ